MSVPSSDKTAMLYTGGRVWATVENSVYIWDVVSGIPLSHLGFTLVIDTQTQIGGSAKLTHTLRVDGKVTCLLRVKNHVWGCGPMGIYLWHSTVHLFRFLLLRIRLAQNAPHAIE